jgi:hypothetical protein
MAMARVCRVVEAPAAALFAALANWGDWAPWVPLLAGAELESGGPGVVGSVRRVGPADAPLVRERLTACDEETFSIAYAFEGPSPFAVRAYAGHVRLIPLTDRVATVVDWQGTFDADGADEADVISTFEGLYGSFIDGLSGLGAQ